MKDRLVTVKVFDTPVAASIALGMLESHSIPAMITNTDFSSLYPVGNPSISGVPLMVRECDLVEARRLLQEHGDL